MGDNFKKHWPAGLLALGVGLMMVGPQLIFIWRLGPAYQGLYMMQSDAETHYLSRMKEACDSGSIGNPYIKEYRDVYPSALYTFSEKILAQPACLGFVSVPNLNLVYKFLLPFLLTLLVYAFFFRLTSSMAWALAGAALVMLGNQLVNLPDLKNFLTGRMLYSQFAMFARPVNPEFSAFFFWGFLHLLLSLFRGPSRRIYLWLGLVLGASFYIYFYLFTFLLALCVIALIFRPRILWSLAIGLLLGLPAIRAFYALVHHPWYAGLQSAYGLTHTHGPVVSLAWLLSALLFASYLWRRRFLTAETKLVLTFLLTALAVINTQVLTGVTLQAGHYHWYFNTPIFFIALVFVLNDFLAGVRPGLLKGLAACSIIISAGSSLFVQASSYIANAQTVAAEQVLMPRLRAIDASAGQNTVVASRPLSELIPIYTKAYVSWDDYAAGYLLPPELRNAHQQK